MAEGGPVYSRETISEHLRSTSFAAVNTLREGAPNSRFMLFACDEPLAHFYLLTNKLTDKVGEVRESADISVAVLTPADQLDDFAETIVRGQATILEDFGDDRVQRGLTLLAEKSPEVEGLKQSGSLGDYVLFELASRTVVFRYYRDVIANAPKTIIEFG